MRAPELWRRRGLVSTLLLPAAGLYAAAGALRWRLATPWRAPVPVLCVGNLVAGGAGKTPVAASLARLLVERGAAPHLLSRGYGGSLAGPVRVDPDRHRADQVGDESLLLARDAPVWVARDRVAAARAAVAAGADLLILDDGFQNPSLAKDFSLLVIDGGYGFGNGRVLPAGPLRETVSSGLARADAVAVLGDDEAAIADRCGTLPVLATLLAPQEAGSFAGMRVVAFAGIGRPEKFFATVARLGADLVEQRGFADHHLYTAAELAALAETAQRNRARLVTTEKDWVRLPDAWRDRVEIVRVAAQWRDQDALLQLLAPVMLSRRAA